MALVRHPVAIMRGRFFGFGGKVHEHPASRAQLEGSFRNKMQCWCVRRRPASVRRDAAAAVKCATCAAAAAAATACNQRPAVRGDGGPGRAGMDSHTRPPVANGAPVRA